MGHYNRDSLQEMQEQARQNIGSTETDLRGSVDEKSILMYNELLEGQKIELTRIDQHIEALEIDDPSLIPGADWAKNFLSTNMIFNLKQPFGNGKG